MQHNSTLPSDDGAMKLLAESGKNEFGAFRWLRWWYRISLPSKPPESANFKLQDKYRRARLASLLLFVMLTIMTAAVLVSALTANVRGLPVVLTVTAVLVIAVLLNRADQLLVEGLLIVGLWTFGLVASFVMQPTINIGMVIQYDLLTIAILLAVTFFPPWSVFLVAIFNCAFVWWSITYLPHDPLLSQLIATDGGVGRLITRPLALTFVLMLITWLWAYSTQHALQRADRAETIATLQYDLAERDQEIAAQKEQLEHSLHNIANTLVSYSNGNFQERIPLSQDNILWNIAGPINNLLSRVQRMRNAEFELNRLRPYLHQARQLEHENAALRAALQKQQGGPHMFPKGTSY